MKLSKNARIILEKRYLKRDSSGKVIETPEKMFRRVAKNIASADKLYDKRANTKKTEEEFYKIMTNLEFLPNATTLRNAGRQLQQLASCFVLPVGDSMEEIFQSVKDLALIQKSGGGTGFSFSRLRPEGSRVGETGGIASGPVSFMKVFDSATAAIKEGGTRRGANIGILRVDHPDIESFITAKKDLSSLQNFNISVAITNKFMTALKEGKKYSLCDPHLKKEFKKVSAGKVFNLLCKMAWLNGEPGVIFIDKINKHNPTPRLGKIEATNPCAEATLLPYESCCLGSINLTKMIESGKINYDKLSKTVKVAVHFLDNIIDMNKYPLPEIERVTKANRKIGLGIMGFADMLIQLNIPYNSEQAVKTAEQIMSFIEKEAKKASKELAKKRGVFPNFKNSIYPKKKERLRNATLTTIAPTGTLSIIADCSSSIEPIFASSYIRTTSDNIKLKETNKNKILVTAHEISPEWHIKIQAAFQKYTDNAISKTVNLPSKATKSDVKKAFMLAYKMGCKGVAVYRYNSRKQQVLNICKKCS